MSPTVGSIPPPPGIVPNFDNPPSLHKYNVLTQSVCLSTSTLFVLARIYTKVRIRPPLGPEDYTCVLAWLGLIIYGTLCVSADKYGNGVHKWDITAAHAVRWAQFANAQEILYGPVILVTKISILLLYAKLFAPRRKSVTYILIQLLLWSNVLFYTAITFVKIFECAPRRKIWMRKTPGHCINFAALLYATGIVNICSDIAIVVLPLNVIWHLQLPATRKIGVSAAFIAALFAPVASILRLAASIRGGGSQDATYSLFPVALWTEAEITTGIICSCLPTLPALYRHYVPKIASRLASNHHINGSRSGKQSFFSSRDKTSSSNYQQGDEPHLLREGYLELGGLTTGDNAMGKYKGPTTNTREGIHVAGSNWNGDDQSSIERLTGDGIVNTVRLETFSQATAPAPEGNGSHV